MSDATLLRTVLAHPRTRGLDIDDPATTALRRDIIREKPFLQDIYREWYGTLTGAVPGPPGAVVELGSGAGFLADVLPGVITSDVFFCPFVRTVLDARALPFTAGALRAVVMTNVLHHVSGPQHFLSEAARAVRPGGVVAMIEPWVSPWSRHVYTRFHHEPFDTSATAATSVVGGPLSGANSALPWILFARDRAMFDRTWPEWSIETVEPMMPFRYVLSGGVSLRSLMPGWTTGIWRRVEQTFGRNIERWAMFALIVLRRTDAPWMAHL